MFTALSAPGMIFAFYQRWLLKLPPWLAQPLGGCGYCFTGQVCLWYYLIFHFNDYNLIDHLFFISTGIFFVAFYEIIWNYANTRLQ